MSPVIVNVNSSSEGLSVTKKSTYSPLYSKVKAVLAGYITSGFLRTEAVSINLLTPVPPFSIDIEA